MQDLPPASNPLFRFSHPVVGMIVAAIPNNYIRRELVAWIEKIECILDCPGEIGSDTLNVTNSLTTVRNPDIMAKATLVTNQGTIPVDIYEEGNLVMRVEPGASEEMPLSGRLTISAKATVAGTTTVTVTTISRCLCGDPYDSGDGIPIGSDLI
jgi:hypothetical protein